MAENFTLLFIDDEVLFLQAIKRLLHSHKEWSLRFAESADKALEVLRQNRIDLIVLDVQMPEKNGFWLLAELKKEPDFFEIPVIILTGNAERDLKRKALDLGATDLLNKPVGYEDLRARISNCLSIKYFQDKIKQHNVTLEQKVRERTQELEFLHKDLIWRLAKAGEYRDEDTGSHLLRVAKYCRLIAESLTLEKDHVDRIVLTSCLHDLGKIGIPDRILLKPGKLTDEEWKIMQTHCRIGESILLEHPFYDSRIFKDNFDTMRAHFMPPDELKRSAALIALNHHEKWDGTGYPGRLKGNLIPIEGRIVALADVYDALMSSRPYKKAFSREETMEYILSNSGTHFDPAIIDSFIQVEPEFFNIQQGT